MTHETEHWYGATPAQAPEIEGAALAIMARATITWQPLLRMWVEAMLHTPSYALPLDVAIEHGDFTGSRAWDELVAREGSAAAAIAGLAEDGAVVTGVQDAILARRAYDRNPRWTARHRRIFSERDRALWWLATALRQYRLDGRPTDDDAHPIRCAPGEDPIARASTLAVAIADYAEAMEGIAAMLEEEMDDA